MNPSAAESVIIPKQTAVISINAFEVDPSVKKDSIANVVIIT